MRQNLFTLFHGAKKRVEIADVISNQIGRVVIDPSGIK